MDVLFTDREDRSFGPWYSTVALAVGTTKDPERREEGEQQRTDPGLQESTQLVQPNDSWDAAGSSCEGQRRSGREAELSGEVCVWRDEAHPNFSYFFGYT